MNNNTKIKLSGVTSLSAARFAAAAGFDYTGFCFDRNSPSYIPPIAAGEMIGWINGSLIVGEFGNQSTDEINDIYSLLKLDIIEVYNELKPEDLALFAGPIIKKINVDSKTTDQLEKELALFAPVSLAVHLYSDMPSEDLYLPEFSSICKRYPIIWGIGIKKETVAHIISNLKPETINISASSEEKAGLQEFGELYEILDAIHEARNTGERL